MTEPYKCLSWWTFRSWSQHSGKPWAHQPRRKEPQLVRFSTLRPSSTRGIRLTLLLIGHRTEIKLAFPRGFGIAEDAIEVALHI